MLVSGLQAWVVDRLTKDLTFLELFSAGWQFVFGVKRGPIGPCIFALIIWQWFTSSTPSHPKWLELGEGIYFAISSAQYFVPCVACSRGNNGVTDTLS